MIDHRYYVDDKDFVYGNVPQTVIDDQEDTLRSIHQNSEAVSVIYFIM